MPLLDKEVVRPYSAYLLKTFYFYSTVLSFIPFSLFALFSSEKKHVLVIVQNKLKWSVSLSRIWHIIAMLKQRENW